MAKPEERVKILSMIEEGKITAEEGARLLTALSRSKESSPTARQSEARWLRVRVSDMDTGKVTVNVSLPIGLVDVGLRMGARFVPDMEGLEIEQLAEALRQGLTGKIIDVIDEEDGNRVEVYVE